MGGWTVPEPMDGVMDALNAAAAAAVPMCLLPEAPPTWPWQWKPAGVWECRRGNEKRRQMVESCSRRGSLGILPSSFFFFRISTSYIFSWVAKQS